MTNRPGRLLRWAAGLLVLVFLAGLFIGGAQPIAVGLIPAPWDKLAHAAAFGTLTVLVAVSLRPPLAWLVTLPLLVTAADEWHQSFLAGRAAGIGDWLAGAVGVLVAAWLLRRRQYGPIRPGGP